MKNSNFMLKAFFIIEIFIFLSWLFGYVEKRLDKIAKVNFKIYDVTDWTANNYNTYIVNILRSKGNQTKEFGRLIEHKMKNNFLEKSYTKCWGEATPRPFYKKSKSRRYLLINHMKCYKVCFYCMSKLRSTKLY